MVAGSPSLTVYDLCMMSQSGWRHCWMEKGVLWDHLTTPSLRMMTTVSQRSVLIAKAPPDHLEF